MYQHVTQPLHPLLTLHYLTWFLTLHVKLTLEYRVWKIELSEVIKWRWKLLHLASSATDNVSFVKNVFSMYIKGQVLLLKCNFLPIDPTKLVLSQDPVCCDRQVQLICHHHDITDTTSIGPIFSQTNPVVWMKNSNGERIDLPDTYHMVVSQSNTEIVVSVTTRKSVFLNGEANYSCTVVYAYGSMEESDPVTVRAGVSFSCENIYIVRTYIFIRIYTYML